MLVLARREGEKIYIGDNIIITLIEANRGRVRLGVEAPKNVKVVRSELIDGYKKPEEKKNKDITE